MLCPAVLCVCVAHTHSRDLRLHICDPSGDRRSCCRPRARPRVLGLCADKGGSPYLSYQGRPYPSDWSRDLDRERSRVSADQTSHTHTHTHAQAHSAPVITHTHTHTHTFARALKIITAARERSVLQRPGCDIIIPGDGNAASVRVARCLKVKKAKLCFKKGHILDFTKQTFGKKEANH